MKRTLFTCLLQMVISFSLISQSVPSFTNGWLIFEKVKYTETFCKDLGEYCLTPSFDNKIRQYENQEIVLKGHFIPLDLESKNTVVLSKYPWSACFFCGEAGPESIAEIRFKGKHPKFKPNQIIQVKGKLMLKDNDINFILTEATLVED